MTEKAARYLDQQMAALSRRIASVAGPLMTAVMGLMTAAVIAAIMSGVMSLNDAAYQ